MGTVSIFTKNYSMLPHSINFNEFSRLDRCSRLRKMYLSDNSCPGTIYQHNISSKNRCFQLVKPPLTRQRRYHDLCSMNNFIKKLQGKIPFQEIIPESALLFQHSVWLTKNSQFCVIVVPVSTISISYKIILAELCYSISHVLEYFS